MSDFSTAFPNSTKVYVDAESRSGGIPGVKVPMREIAIGGGEASLRVYDTSGPQGYDVAAGLPKLRAPWVKARNGHRRGTQLHYARKGDITEAVEFIAVR